MSESAQAVISVIDPTYPVDYSKTETPPNYKCGKCGATGCKLWREYQTFLEHQSLRCALCAGADEGKETRNMDANGTVTFERHWRSDQIGWMVPAVPTEENDAYWGYTSVPQAGYDWWRRLPTFSVDQLTTFKVLAAAVIAHAKQRRHRGRKPSLAYRGERNPFKALALAHKDLQT